MALTDHHGALLARPDSAPLPVLTRLSQIHHESLETTQAARFLHSAVPVSALLAGMGGLFLLLAGGTGLPDEFVWALLVLAGLGAMLRCHIKSSTQGFGRLPLRHAAKHLRALVLYTGIAWGAGAFLVLGTDPLPFAGLCFALLPSLGVAVLLKDLPAALRFVLPVALVTAAAILIQPWSAAPAALGLLLLLEGSIAGCLWLGARRPAEFSFFR